MIYVKYQQSAWAISGDLRENFSVFGGIFYQIAAESPASLVATCQRPPALSSKGSFAFTVGGEGNCARVLADSSRARLAGAIFLWREEKSDTALQGTQILLVDMRHATSDRQASKPPPRNTHQQTESGEHAAKDGPSPDTRSPPCAPTAL